MQPQMPDPDTLDPSGELSAQMQAQTAEYGTYVANQPIDNGAGVLAYAEGHPVPVSNVVRHNYARDGKVDLVPGQSHPAEVREQLGLDPEPTDAAPSDPAPAASVSTMDALAGADE